MISNMIYSTHSMGAVLRYEIIHPVKKDFLNNPHTYYSKFSTWQMVLLEQILQKRIDFDFEIAEHEVDLLEDLCKFFYGKHAGLLVRFDTAYSHWKNKEQSKLCFGKLGT